MITWIYLLKVMAAQGIFLAAYYLLLDRLPLGQVKRVYLLAALIISFLLPLLPVHTPVEMLNVSAVGGELLPQPDWEPDVPGTPAPSVPIDSVNWLARGMWMAYLIGLVYGLCRLAVFLKGVHTRLGQGKRSWEGGVEEVVLPYATAPHTFMRYVFYSDKVPLSGAVLAHERVHARELHSVDRIFMALLCAVWWWNPLLHLYARCVAANHELLADSAVLRMGHPLDAYRQEIFESLRAPSPVPYLASAARYTLTKKRFLMMTNTTPSLATRLTRYTLLGLLSVTIVYFLGGQAAAESSSPSPLPSASQPVPLSREVNDEELPILSEDTILPPPPVPEEWRKKMRPITPNSPLPADLKAWSDSDTYGVWIDGQRIQNQRLADYASDDFAHYYSSKLEKNAVNFGKHVYQIDLYSIKYFESFYRRMPDGTYEWIGEKTTKEAAPQKEKFGFSGYGQRLLLQSGAKNYKTSGEGC
ncbi:MAG: M56 family metallopeptidase [Lewinella sp.]